MLDEEVDDLSVQGPYPPLLKRDGKREIGRYLPNTEKIVSFAIHQTLFVYEMS